MRRLTGSKDHKGQYEVIEQQHATVQMADIIGLSALHSSSSEQQDHEHLQVDYMAEPAAGVSYVAESGLLEHLLPSNIDTCLFCAPLGWMWGAFGHHHIRVLAFQSLSNVGLQ